jgi:hypothetical protein
VPRAEALRKGAPLLARLDHEHLRAGSRRHGGHLKPHRARSYYRHAVARLRLGLVAHRVQAIGQRLDEHGSLDGQVSDRQRSARPAAGHGRDRGELGVAAVGVAVDPLAGGDPLHVVPGREHPPDPLVAGVERVLAIARADGVLARVGGADPAGLDLHEHLAGRRLGRGQ